MRDRLHRFSGWGLAVRVLVFFFVASLGPVIASGVLFKEDFEDMEGGEKFVFDPAAGSSIEDAQSLIPKVGRVILRIDNNGEISEGLAGTAKGFKFTDGGDEKAGALRIRGGPSDKFYLTDMDDHERLKIAFDVRFDGEFSKTLFDFRVQGYSAEQRGITLAVAYVNNLGQLNVTNNTEKYNAFLALPQKLFTAPPEGEKGIEYHFEFLFNLKTGVYDLSVFANGDLENPLIYEAGLSFVGKDPNAQQELAYFDHVAVDVASSNFGPSGAITVDNLLMEIVEVPQEMGRVDLGRK